MRGQYRRDYRQANRGRALEQLVEIANRQYRARGIAVVHKVPTAWLPIRDHSGKIVTAKVVDKAIVDFVGIYRRAAIAFDAKETAGHRIRWDRVEPHQGQFLDDWERAGGLAFILVELVELPLARRHFVVPWAYWKNGLAQSRNGGSASVSVDTLEAMPECAVQATMRAAIDYLEAVDRLWPDKLREKVG
jgi:recombination protein U